MKRLPMTIGEIEQTINEKLKEINLHAELHGYDSVNNCTQVSYYINWGDWKHQHLRFDWAMQELFAKLNISIRISTYATEEDGSDCYCGVHVIHFN